LASRRRGSGFLRQLLSTARFQTGAAEVACVTAEVKSTEKNCEAQECDEPQRQRLQPGAWLALFALSRSVDFFDVNCLAVIYSLLRARLWLRSGDAHCQAMSMAPPAEIIVPAGFVVLLSGLVPGYYLFSDDWSVFACSKCDWKIGRPVSRRLFSSAFFALGSRTLSSAPMTDS
jgi:hypothetical protein